jgi:hypothetical protein
MNDHRLLLLAALFFVAAPGAYAELETRLGGKAVYDTDRDITWLADANLPLTQKFNLASSIQADGSMTWPVALEYIAAMNDQQGYLGIKPWRLTIIESGCLGVDCREDEFGHLFYAELKGTPNTDIGSSGNPDLLSLFSTNTGVSSIEQGNTSFYWSSSQGTYVLSFSFSGGLQAERHPNFNTHFVWPVFDGDPEATLFNDVPFDYWARSFVETLAASGITAGCGNSNFCPEAFITRAQMAVFLQRGMKGSDYVPPAASGNVFLDVGAGEFAANFIEQLFADGITAGCGNNNYCPNAEVTRAQMAVFLLRAKYGAEYSPPAATGVFNDVDLGYWAAHWIEQLATEGITAGCGNGNFCPEIPVTRAQMAVFLVRAFGL